LSHIIKRINPKVGTN